MTSSRVQFVLDNPWQFARQVFGGFRANQGFLLAGSVAYHTLLSIVPMFALILVFLSQIKEPQELLDTRVRSIIDFGIEQKRRETRAAVVHA